ncbi:Potassium channel protein [Olavius sp. associated proteobacterium Delta 1]|nr:Potassium channel protein [Olavius sp. associated proteobacterium Delta 1]
MLLAAILGMIIGSPFLDDIFHYAVIPDIFITIIFILGIYAISHKKLHIYIAVALAIPMFIGVWSAYIFKSPYLAVLGHFFGALLIGFVIGLLIKLVFNEKEITKEAIFAAVVVYLLMAMMWSNAFLILEFFYPGSFSIPESPSLDPFQFLYFSFVTITTLGYGDVAPLTHKASSLVILEAVTGQIYLVVIVAWLVGMYVSRRSK